MLIFFFFGGGGECFPFEMTEFSWEIVFAISLQEREY